MQKDWKSVLTDEEFFVCRKKGTEPAFSGDYDKFYEDGVYYCKCCKNKLFDYICCGIPILVEGGPNIKRFCDDNGIEFDINNHDYGSTNHLPMKRNFQKIMQKYSFDNQLTKILQI